MTEPEKQAHFDDTTTAVVIQQLTIRDKDVVREAQRWTTGERGAADRGSRSTRPCRPDHLRHRGLRIGAHALSVTGQAQEITGPRADAQGRRRQDQPTRPPRPRKPPGAP